MAYVHSVQPANELLLLRVRQASRRAVTGDQFYCRAKGFIVQVVRKQRLSKTFQQFEEALRALRDRPRKLVPAAARSLTISHRQFQEVKP